MRRIRLKVTPERSIDHTKARQHLIFQLASYDLRPKVHCQVEKHLRFEDVVLRDVAKGTSKHGAHLLRVVSAVVTPDFASAATTHPLFKLKRYVHRLSPRAAP